MERRKKAIVIAGLAVAAVAVGVVLLLCCFSRCTSCAPAPEAEEKPAAAAEPVDPVKERMSDPVYLKKLDKQREGQQAAMRAIGAAKAALAKAEEAGADAEELAKLKGQVAEAFRQLEENRLQSQRIVADQIRGQLNK